MPKGPPGLKARESKVRAKSGKGTGKRGDGEQQQFPCVLHPHPNFYDFIRRAVAPFNGNDRLNVNRDQVVWQLLWRAAYQL